MALWSPHLPHQTDAHAESGRLGAGPWVWQLWIVVPILLLATAALSTWMVMRANQATAAVQLQNQQADETELIARLIGSKLEQSQKVLTTVAEAAAPWALDSKPTLEWLIDQGLPATRYFDSLVFARETRVFRLNFRTGEEEGPEIEPVERDLLRRVMVDGKPQVSEPMKTAVGGPSIAFGLPLRDKTGEVQGAMAGVLRLQSQSLLPASLAAQSSGGSQLVVMTAQGVIISHPDPTRILTAATDEPALAQALDLWRDKPTTGSKSSALTQWNAPALISVADIPSARWLVVRVVDRGQALPLAQQLGAAWWIFAVPVGIALLAVLWLWWHTQRLRHMAAALPPVADGDPQWVDDELGRIAQRLQWQDAQQVTLAQRLRTQVRLNEGVLVHAPFAFMLLNNELITEVSQALAHFLGYDRQDLMGRSVHMLAAAASDFDELWLELAPGLQRHGSAEAQVALRHQSGATVAATVQLVQVEHGGPGMVWCFIRPGGSKVSGQSVGRIDKLTQLPNYDALFLHLGAMLQGLRDVPADAAPVLFYVNVDNMSTVNALAGHAQGDIVLQHVAHQLQLLQPFQGFAARVAGDKFALVLRQCSREKADALATQLCETLQDWMPELRGRHFAVTVSVGLLRLGLQYSDAQHLIRVADIACYEAKRNGGNSVRWGDAQQAQSKAGR